ncbi:MAG: hypothetical protein IMZ66_13795, partial [Planctomycetes bacterium]|nr:hypothetical protein [Planctomycetota bacterium]
DHQPVLLREVIDDVDHRRRHRTYGPTPEEQRSLALDAAGLLANLPAGLREIAARMAGSNEAHVARELGVSRRQVRKAVEAIRQHFEAAGLVKD